jgi:hypothetical protein
MASAAYLHLMDLLEHYSFEVNRKKSTPPQESLVFWGYLISKLYVAPTATRTSVTLEFAEAAWQPYLQLKPDAREKWFSSIAGTFHLSRPFLDSECAEYLQVFYDNLKLLRQVALAKVNTETVHDALFRLITYLRDGLPPSILFHFDRRLRNRPGSRR